MPELHDSWPWVSLVPLGAFHGLNPAMGWLFAVAIGFQERRFRAVISALGPITLGHALSVGLIAVPVGAFADPTFPPPRISIYGVRRHPWTAMPGLEIEDHD